jgi:hypothetical protein
MTLENTILKSLSEWRTFRHNDLYLDEPEGPWKVQITADRCDELGCRVWELALRRPAPAAGASLAGWAEKIAANARGLPDALKVYEVDEHRREAVLRSETPQQKGGKVLYFEVLVRNTTEATLRRYQATAEGQGKRDQVPFVLTHEHLAGVAQGIASDR